MSAFTSVRKYLALLSAFFAVMATLHLVTSYLFSDSKTVPEKGGAISVGFVGSAPGVSPIQFRKDPAEDFILRFLYRSLLRYDIETRTMQGDLANCDLGRNFSEIRCFFKPGPKWNDGTPITKEDVLATYRLYSETNSNKTLQAALAKTTVEDDGEAIVFKTANPNVDLLDVFTLPIVSAKMADKVRAGNFSVENDAVYSGPFVLENSTPESGKSGEKIVVSSNPNASSEHFVSKFVFRFFPDAESLVAAKDSLNLVYPNRSLPPVSSPRFATLNLLLPEFVGVFANASKMPDELRRYVLSVVGNAKIAEKAANAGKPVSNPFFTDDSIVPEPDNKNYDGLLAKLGYFKKAELISDAEKAAKDNAAKKTVSVSYNRYFQSPSNRKVYVGGDSDDILVSGVVPDSVTEVYVNDYELKNFVPKSGKFYYRAKIAIGTMKEGKNVYSLAFTDASGKKAFRESLTIEYVKDATAREARRAELAAAEKASAVQETNSGALVTAELAKARAKYESLSDTGYFNKDGKRLTLKLSYVEVAPEISGMADAVAESLEAVGIAVEKTAISPDDFNTVVKDGKKDYDLLLTGVNLGLMGYNVFPFFHSGQAEIGFNFSKVKNPDLDTLLEELKSKDLGEEGLRAVRDRVLAILKREAVVLTFTRPAVPYSIDRGVRKAQIVETLPTSSYLYDVLEDSYVKESRLADFRTKSVSGYFGWFKSLLVPEDR
ncbi:MAG: ABC transporter substrate-binding protein [Patescibacteria group bacterium]